MITHDAIRKAPQTCGVYLFRNDTEPVYIGKAVHLKARLSSHMQNAKLDAKEARIIREAQRIEIRPTLTEFDALMLEAYLIQKYQPKYNVSWKDGKSHLYIKITIKETYPKILIVRKENDGQSLYFGPFQSTRMARSIVSHIRTITPFCTQQRVSTRKCFYAKLGLCDPCPNVIEKIKKNGTATDAMKLRHIYKKNIRRVRHILEGNSQRVYTTLERELQDNIDRQEYERALQVRDRLHHLRQLLTKRSFDYIEVSGAVIDEQRVKKELYEFLKEHFSISKKKTSYRMECFDVSNLFGRHATASCVVFINASSDKKQYRRYKITNRLAKSDFDMLREVLTRRFGADNTSYPDLLVVDGGRPQLRVVSAVLDEKKITIPYIGIAKRPDRIYIGIDGFPKLNIRENSPLFSIVRAIRDESHRFARKYHLLLRNKNLLL